MLTLVIMTKPLGESPRFSIFGIEGVVFSMLVRIMTFWGFNHWDEIRLKLQIWNFKPLTGIKLIISANRTKLKGKFRSTLECFGYLWNRHSRICKKMKTACAKETDVN